MQRLELDSIGTHLTLTIDTTVSCEVLFATITEKLQRFEAKFSRFIRGNWLDKLNIERIGTLDADGYDMLSYALEVARKSDGYFDPTIAGTLSTLGYGREEHRGHSVGWQNIILDGIEVRLEGDVILEFGGVGKGYLIDLIRSMITNCKLGIPDKKYLIDFGGDLYGQGGWKVGLESPYALDEVIGTLSLDRHFLACSSGTKRRWGNHHHLIDPKTGASATDVRATFIEGTSGIMSDSYATALSVMPFDRACTLLQDSVGLEGVIISSDGRIYQSEGSRSEMFTL